MPTQVARNDAVVVRQVTNITPTVTNSAVYDLKLNSKQSRSYTADGSATAQEIVEGLQALLDANADEVPEIDEVTWTEDDTQIIATGRDDGQPFTVIDGAGSGTWASITTATTAKSPNHWIAENFSSGTLPAAGEDIILTQLSPSQSFYWGLDQNTVTLGSLDIRADSEAEIGLPEINTDADAYYQANYRDTFLKISASVLKIGDGTGNGSKRIKINLGSVDCAATVYKTSNSPADTDEGAVQLSGGTAASSLQVLAGTVDLAMLPSHTGSWGTIVASGGTVRCGSGVTLAVVEAAGNATVETRSAITTARTRDSGKIRHIGAANITTLDIAGGDVEVQATGALTIATLNGYSGRKLDLSKCDSNVTITNMNVYATPDNPFQIEDPNNKLVMTNAAACQGGAQSLVVRTGSGRNVRIT